MNAERVELTEIFGFTTLLPRYSEVRSVLPILVGEKRSLATSLIARIGEQTGTPQNTLDWSAPSTWIHDRLSGDEARLASRLWQESNETVNPRYFRGVYYCIHRHMLLGIDQNDYYVLTERSEQFIESDPKLIDEIDELEGLPQILGMIATRSRAKPGELLPEWTEFVQERSNYRAESSIRSLLRYRLLNLQERGLLSRDGQAYSVTPSGIERAVAVGERHQSVTDVRREVARQIRAYNQAQFDLLRERLASIDPFQFEHLIRDLLEAMGYEDVMVTNASGDKGVDVIATVEFGITTIKEVVQVKRQRANVRRPLVDQLRGALPYHQAIRGTPMTLGGFSPGCKEAALFPGAAPISLIDGDRLVELLVDHEIGIKKRPAVLFEIDDDYFDESAEADLEVQNNVLTGSASPSMQTLPEE